VARTYTGFVTALSTFCAQRLRAGNSGETAESPRKRGPLTAPWRCIGLTAGLVRRVQRCRRSTCGRPA